MNKRNLGRSLVLVSAALACIGSVGCSGGAPLDDTQLDESGDALRTEEASLLPVSCTAMGSTINSHTCAHGSLGPFVAVTASSNPNFAGSTPKFNAIHTYYTVTLPSAGGGLYRGTVKFTPANDDDHVLYVKPTVTVSVKDKSGATVASQLSSAFATCPAYLTNYSVHELKKGTSFAPYKITFEATVSTIQVALEEVKPMRERWYPDADLDGFGPTSPSELTACVPSAGYVTTTSGDCNDSNAGVYPGNGCP